jgi:acyl carrier protein
MFDRSKIEAELVATVQLRGQRHTKVTAQTELLEAGLLDSLLLVDLIFHLEELYNIRFDSNHIDPSNFRNIAAIADLVTNRMLATGQRSD